MSGRFAAYLRRGDLETAGPLALLFAVPAALEYVILGMPGLSAATAPLIVIALAAICGLGWLVSAKLASDVAATQALNREAAARAEQLDERFTGSPVPFDATEDEFARITEEELDALPGWLKTKIDETDVAIGIEDERPGQPRVLGLYQQLGRESQITLYRRPIIRAAGSREALRRQIHGTLLHELGHLFGMTEEDLDHYQIGNHPLPGAAPIRESEIGG
jgi:predicted Zn-dependent protease with MMP-like domain